ncbi:MAG: hypothetical protein OQK27_06370, partial [Gammaproteobacteria bacterium]|nr:hypothetical protein [Gammaproteobacteria bacterium]
AGSARAICLRAKLESSQISTGVPMRDCPWLCTAKAQSARRDIENQAIEWLWVLARGRGRFFYYLPLRSLRLCGVFIIVE